MKKTLGLLLAALALCATAHAQDWPQKAVRVIVPYGPGSAPDGIARVVFERIARNTGKPMVVENRTGAAGMIGADIVAKAAPDGYTLVVAASGPLSTNSLLYKKMAYDPLKDLAPVALMGETGTILVVNNNVKATNVKELLAEMAKPENKMAYASSGNGTQGHISMAFLVARSGADIPHVPYAGSPLIINAVLAGDVQMATMPPLTVMPQIKAGKMRALAVVGPTRHFLLPDTPTLKEQGIDFDIGGWVGVSTTAKTPRAVIEKIHQEIAAALKQPEVIESFKSQGMDVSDKGPADFNIYLNEELKRWAPIISKNNISLE